VPQQVPPFPAEPPPDPDKGKEQIKAEQPQPLILTGPEPQEVRPGILIYPDQSEELGGPSIVEDRKGDDRTKDFNEAVRDWFLSPEKKAEGWKHVAGGRERPGIGHNSGEKPDVGELSENEESDVIEKEEEYIPNPVKDFEKDVFKRRVDGRKGSNYVDLTFYNEKTDQWVRIQTVDVDKNGKPTQRELDNAWSIRQRTGATVILIKKPWK
jgi:hypothetical protein